MSRIFTDTATARNIRLKRTRPFRPQTNGKAEAFNKILQAEWAYLRPYYSNRERLDALPGFLGVLQSPPSTRRHRRGLLPPPACKQRPWELHLAFRSFAASMSKLSTRMILLALTALVAACSSPTPTPFPTATPVLPSPTATPTSAPTPTAAPAPTVTPRLTATPSRQLWALTGAYQLSDAWWLWLPTLASHVLPLALIYLRPRQI